MMYTQEDMRRSTALLHRYVAILCAVLLPLLGLYVFAAVKGSQMAMLLILIAALCFAGPETALYLAPALRYRNFLREMEKGLRRECLCSVESVDETVQMQDGVRVFALQVRLKDGDTRLFYLNASKKENFPPENRALRLISFGRHVVDWRAVE